MHDDYASMFFQGWPGIVRTLMVGTLAYLGLVLLLRISGKRTLSKMNAFDFVVTVALGSTLATILLSKDVALVEGLTAFALLILLQFLVAWLSIRSKRFRRWIRSEPTLLLHNGHYLRAAMRRERVTEADIAAAIRMQGKSGPQQVAAVILESDGSFSVLTAAASADFDSVLSGARTCHRESTN